MKIPDIWRVLWLLTVVASLAYAEEPSPVMDADSSNNQEGSLNTNTVGSTVSSNNNSMDSSVSNTYNGAGSSSDMPVGSAIAPSYMSNGVETCLQGQGGSLQTGIVGITRGSYKEDDDCNRRRDSKVLSDLGMKVAAIARMCEDTEIWRSMFVSGTPCPMLAGGKLIVGKRAFLLMRREPETYIPDYGRVKTLNKWIDGEWTPVRKYTAKQEWYNKLLRGEENGEEVNSDDKSVSDRFRSSLQRARRSDSDE